MTSQLQLRIEEALRTERDRVRRATLLARKAMYVARIGSFEEADFVIFELRREFADGHSGTAMAWIMLAEGLVRYFRHLDDSALDRVARCQLLAIAIKDAELISTSSAWKAHIEFESSKFESMFISLAVSRDHLTAENHAAQSRHAIVLCNLFLICGKSDAAQRAFRRGHHHALKDGDQASVEALLYNKAAFGLARARVESCRRQLEADELSFLRLEVASARNLQDLTGVSALTHIVDFCDAHLLILEEKFERAVERLEGLRTAGPYGSYNFSQSYVDLEVSYCLFRRKLTDSAADRFLSVQISELDRMDIDERLVGCWMTCQMAARDPRFGCEVQLKERLGRYFAEYDEMIEKLLASLVKFSD